MFDPFVILVAMDSQSMYVLWLWSFAAYVFVHTFTHVFIVPINDNEHISKL